MQEICVAVPENILDVFSLFVSDNIRTSWTSLYIILALMPFFAQLGDDKENFMVLKKLYDAVWYCMVK